MQRCPDDPNAPQSAPSTASGTSASSRTTIAFFPPSSRPSRFNVFPQYSAICRPAVVEPVKEMPATRGSLTSGSPASAALPVTKFSTPPGRPASSRISTSLVAMIGVSDAGLNTTVFPAISAGKIFQVGMARGKFQGVMQPMTPSGSRRVSAALFLSSEGTVSPKGRRPKPAAYLPMSIASWTSPRASLRTLPISWVISRASSSFRCSIRRPARRMISPRAGAGVRRQPANAFSAAPTAASTSWALEACITPSTRSLCAGFTELKVRPVFDSTQRPPM